ncbi:MAG: hypothetical protein JJLCMIEE_00999 [Acidimicrobiales bacterium]|nr:MAG: SIS domain-containing protein [Actinomycetota bacterium]MBV6507941.1 hypothetical protein [Acidimicrobiales bacterium]RIK06917.1 MAG: glucosamine-6-phosphate synthase [Acidobacteriota bacterium]
MCGIIAILRKPSGRLPPTADELLAPLESALKNLDHRDGIELAERLGRAVESVRGVDLMLRGLPGLRSLVDDRSIHPRLQQLTEQIRRCVTEIEERLDRSEIVLTGSELESVNASLVGLKDGTWAIARDRLHAVESVIDLAGSDATTVALGALLSVQQALSALDRLEVRGRDSAGLEVVVTGHGLDLEEPAIAGLLADRMDEQFRSGSVRVAGGNLCFVYKAAAEIGELGDNTAHIRRAVADDELLHLCLRSERADALVLGHTRWASVGVISEPNAHPLTSEEVGVSGPLVTGALNGDVDNYADLRMEEGLRIAPEITTDAKVIPTLVSHRMKDGEDFAQAFRDTVRNLEGSVAIAANSVADGHRLMLAQRGSGQALYIGLAEDAFVVASEPYGLVEETSLYLRMDGETPSDPGSAAASRGQVIELDARGAGSLDGVERWSYDGADLPVDAGELQTAEITTRDIDRGAFPHFLLKEIHDAPASFRKTLRGKLIEEDGRLGVQLGRDCLSRELEERLRDGGIAQIHVVGQGTAAVAGLSLAAALSDLLVDTTVRIDALPATELSGFGLSADMTETLVIAISQSGTTTDTNRTVDLARARGAAVIAIVNRRNSDLTDKADGVLYTSDGRDVEMSVASTKAFYAQVAAGFLLAYGIAGLVPGSKPQASQAQQDLLRDLQQLPAKMSETLERRSDVAVAAQHFAPTRRYWAVVGNGANTVAAREIRIKLSELCYKSIACDVTEDKKHIDLSAEPLILVCAAGLSGSNAGDVGKEVDIYRAHKAAPIVIASDGESSFGSALHVIRVPQTHCRLAFVLTAMAGHLFGYEAALAIDAQARPLREARAAIEALATDGLSEIHGEELLRRLEPKLVPIATGFFDSLRAGEYDGHLEAGTAVRVASLFRYALGISELGSYQVEFGKVGTPGVVLEDLTSALNLAIEELTRPVDAIKHQAKTVTVGISRSDEALMQIPLIAATLAAGAPRDQLHYNTLRTLAALDPAVEEVTGYTRYRIELDGVGTPRALVVDRGGISTSFASRVDRDPRLRGTKALVAREQEPVFAKGRADGRTVVIVPEVKDSQTTGLTLLHVQVPEHLEPSIARGVLQGYRHRYQALRDAVTETEDTFREDLLASRSVTDLLTVPVLQLANHWRT